MNKDEKKRQRVLSRPQIETSRARLEEKPDDPEAWYDYGMALSLAGREEEAIEVFSEGLIRFPFDAYLYFGRGRRLAAAGRFWAGLADLNMATRIDPDDWYFWYYAATSKSLNGRHEEAVRDFETCVRLTDQNEHAPLVFWLYTTCLLELQDEKAAQKALLLFAEDSNPPQMDYGYVRSVKLFKGQISADRFIDLDDMEKNCLPQENRIRLELNTMYFGLYAYAVSTGDEQLADDALRKLLEVAVPMSFGYKRGLVHAKKRKITD